MIASALAWAVVALHLGFVAFVLLGGLALRRAEWLVWLHAPALVYAIAVQSIGWRCPLTDRPVLPASLRARRSRHWQSVSRRVIFAS